LTYVDPWVGSGGVVQAITSSTASITVTGTAANPVLTFGPAVVAPLQITDATTTTGTSVSLTDSVITSGTSFLISSSSITSGVLISLAQTASAFSGTGLLMSFGTGGGTFTGNFINLMRAGVAQFAVNSVGAAIVGTAVIAANAPRISQLTPLFTITSGALPTITPAALAAGTQVIAARQVALYIPCTFTPGAATTAAVTVSLSPDNITYSTLCVETVPAGVALDNFIRMLTVIVPAGWYVQAVPNAQASVGTATYA
jgi:hypothetical protein